MNSVPDEDWLDVLDRTDFEPDSSSSNSYQSYRFVDLDIASVTIENYKELLVASLAEQVEMFIPPSGSFETPDLRRYLELVCGYETSTSDLVLGRRCLLLFLGFCTRRGSFFGITALNLLSDHLQPLQLSRCFQYCICTVAVHFLCKCSDFRFEMGELHWVTTTLVYKHTA